MAIYLLIKEHADTGLKYLCKHVANSFSDCEDYHGSGTYWKKHLKKYGKNIKTTCLFVTEDEKEFKKTALEYSLKFDIINSNEWANLCNEEGQGGNTIIDKQKHSFLMKEVHKRPEVKVKVRKHLNILIPKIQPLAAKAAKEKLTGVSKTEEHKQKMRGSRPHIDQSVSKNNNAKRIKTPFGIFGSIKEASQKLNGYTYRMIHNRLAKSVKDWEYLNND